MFETFIGTLPLKLINNCDWSSFIVDLENSDFNISIYSSKEQFILFLAAIRYKLFNVFSMVGISFSHPLGSIKSPPPNLHWDIPSCLSKSYKLTSLAIIQVLTIFSCSSVNGSNL